MATAVRTPFVVERIDLAEPDRAQTWELETVEDAAAKFESEVGPSNWPYEDALEELQAGISIGYTDVADAFEVKVRRPRPEVGP